MCVVAFRFLPSTCPEHCPVLLDEDGMFREAGVKRDLSRRLEFSAWLLAWDRYAIGGRRLHHSLLSVHVCVCMC